ncbi:MAG: nucleoside hydrolase [Verrucomicrobia bacterium]|nr:nucleoside hydrolase [Verrucomicrobiota bacterium]
MQNDTQAIEQLEKQINATHRYGHDGLEDVGGWPQATAAIQNMPGHEKIALSVLRATPATAVTLVSTAGLTDLAQALELLVHFDPDGHFVQNINAIIIRGGCMTPGLECNAPPFKPDDKKDSELSFFFDPPSAQTVFSICQQYQIPIVLLPLALTQQPGLLWTKKQVETLEAINNDVAAQMAKITKVIPYLDARHFPAGTYPMHDLFAAAALLRPEFFIANRTSVSIGPLGQIVTDSSADVQNVYVLSMPQEQQSAFYDTILKEYDNFNCTGEASAEGCIPPNVWELYLKIGIPVCVGVGGIILLLTICYFRSRRNNKQLATEKTKLLATTKELESKTALQDVQIGGMEQMIVGLRAEMGESVLPEDYVPPEDDAQDK